MKVWAARMKVSKTNPHSVVSHERTSKTLRGPPGEATRLRVAFGLWAAAWSMVAINDRVIVPVVAQPMGCTRRNSHWLVDPHVFFLLLANRNPHSAASQDRLAFLSVLMLELLSRSQDDRCHRRSRGLAWLKRGLHCQSSVQNCQRQSVPRWDRKPYDSLASLISRPGWLRPLGPPAVPPLLSQRPRRRSSVRR